MTRVFIIEEDGSACARDIDTDADNIRNIIGDWVDHTTRVIGDTRYDIVCDDMGLIKERAPTAFVENGPFMKVALVGTLIITKWGDDWQDLTQGEVREIANHLFQYTDEFDNRRWAVMVQ